MYLKWAVVFLLLWLFLKNTFLTNALEDWFELQVAGYRLQVLGLKN
jgi:hypothetical protein